MTTYEIVIQGVARNLEAMKMNAEILGMQTVPDAVAEFTTHVEADSADEAMQMAFEQALDLRWPQ